MGASERTSSVVLSGQASGQLERCGPTGVSSVTDASPFTFAWRRNNRRPAVDTRTSTLRRVRGDTEKRRLSTHSLRPLRAATARSEPGLARGTITSRTRTPRQRRREWACHRHGRLLLMVQRNRTGGRDLDRSGCEDAEGPDRRRGIYVAGGIDRAHPQLVVSGDQGDLVARGTGAKAPFVERALERRKLLAGVEAKRGVVSGARPRGPAKIAVSGGSVSAKVCGWSAASQGSKPKDSATAIAIRSPARTTRRSRRRAHTPTGSRRAQPDLERDSFAARSPSPPGRGRCRSCTPGTPPRRRSG